MTRRRYSKRQRNKSSPQTLQDSKKYRSHLAEDIAEAEVETESDISDHSGGTVDNLNQSAMASLNHELPGESNMDTLSQSDPASANLDVSQTPSIANTEQALSQPNSQSEIPLSQMATPPPPPQFLSQPMMSANMGPHMGAMYMPTTSPMNLPQQMLNFASQMQPAPQRFVLSDEDVLRVALQMKTLLKEDIDKLVETRIALEVEPLKTQLTAANTSIAELQEKVKNLARQQDDLEQYSHKSCLRVSGVNETANEDINKVVLELANHVEADINQSDIVAAHRLGVENKNDSGAARSVIGRKKCRDIIVKFSNFDARYRLLKGRAKLRDAHSKIFINEELTRTRRMLAYESRQLKKKNLIKKTWVYKGNVYILDKSDNKLCVWCLDDLSTYLTRV